MGSLLKRVRGRLRVTMRSAADQQLEELTKRLADIVSPKIRSVRGYTKALREPISLARAHSHNMVAALGEPVTIAPDHWLTDPLVNALFVSVDHLREVLFRNKEVAAVMNREDVLECCFLLTTSRVERQGFGSRIEGEIIRRDIPHTGVTFTDHRIVALSPDPERTRKMLVDLALEFKAKRLAEHLLRNQAKIREFDELRETLRIELKLLELSAHGLHAAFSDQAAVIQKRDELKKVLQEVEQELHQAGAGFQDLKDYLDYMRAALMASEEILSGSEVRIWLDEAGIISNDHVGGNAREVRFVELTSGDIRRVAVLARIDKSALKRREQFG
jgi:hypothetical protein